jgi:hypothetical protein
MLFVFLSDCRWIDAAEINENIGTQKGVIYLLKIALEFIFIGSPAAAILSK